MDSASGQHDGDDSDRAYRPLRLGSAILGAHRHICVEIMRTHPVLQENPFFVPPEEFVRELHERRAGNARLVSGT